jgi:hypothetical protein
MNRQPEEHVEVLRALWSASGQTEADLDDCFGEQKSCKRMQDVGYDDLGGGGDLHAAWREQLRREGKLDPDAVSVRDLVMRRADVGR